MFPSTVEDYEAVRNKDAKLRVARFLMADILGKERMISEFGWSWKQVRKLEEEYEQNVSLFFAAFFFFSSDATNHW
jgi:hypothetical protein